MKVRLFVLSLVGLLGLSATALAQYQPADGPVELSTTNLDPGDEVEVSGSGFAPGSEVVLTIESEPVMLATVTANSGGSFSSIVTVPSNVAAGQHTISATGIDPSGAPRVLAAQVSVGGSLPFTGLPLDWVVVGAVVLLTLGAAMLAMRGRLSES
ncbi:MAG: hypothetical protein ACRDWA_10910 [Acidimicrobiia bacterium]